jgi:hypothetical protein
MDTKMVPIEQLKLQKHVKPPANEVDPLPLAFVLVNIGHTDKDSPFSEIPKELVCLVLSNLILDWEAAFHLSSPPPYASLTQADKLFTALPGTRKSFTLFGNSFRHAPLIRAFRKGLAYPKKVQALKVNEETNSESK